MNMLTEIALPILMIALASFFVALTGYYINKLQQEKPKLMDAIREGAEYVIPIVEQFKKKYEIKDNAAAKSMAVEMVKAFARERGFKADQVELYVEMIEDAIEGAVNKYNVDRMTTTFDISPIETK
jgi:hypothetical protein